MSRIAYRVGCLVVILFLLQAAFGQLANSGWAKFGANAGNTFQATGKGAVGKAKWTFYTLGGLATPVVTAPDGTIYFGTDNGKLVAQTAAHVVKWVIQPGNQCFGVPTLATDGTIYINDGEQLFAVSPAGNVKWSYKPHQLVITSPLLGPDGTLYVEVAVNPGIYLAALSPNGTVKWTLPNCPAPSVVGSDGTIYLITTNTLGIPSNDIVEALQPNGSLKWQLEELNTLPNGGGTVNSGLAMGASGDLYFVGKYNVASSNKLSALTCLSPDGSIKWLRDAPAGKSFGGQPVVGPNGTIYVVCGGLCAITPSGEWAGLLAVSVEHPPVIGADGTLYIPGTSGLVACDSSLREKWFLEDSFIIDLDSAGPNGTVYFTDTTPGKLYQVSAAGSVEWSEDMGGVFLTAPAIGPDGTLYANTFGNTYAIGSNGAPKWKYSLVGFNQGSPAVGADGMVYATCATGTFALRSDSSFKWFMDEVITFSNQGPAVGPDGTVFEQSFQILSNGNLGWYVEAFSGNCPALDGSGDLYEDASAFSSLNVSNGSVNWSAGSSSLYPVVCASGLVLGWNSSGVVAYNSSGAEQWSIPAPVTALAVSNSGTIYTATSGDGLSAYRSSGALLWNQPSYKFSSNLAIGGDGIVYFCSSDGYLYAVRPGTGAVAWTYKVSGTSVSIGPDGTLYVAGGGNIYAID